MNRRGEKPENLLSPCKRKLQQDQEKIQKKNTKTKKNQIEPEQKKIKFELKQPMKTKKTE